VTTDAIDLSSDSDGEKPEEKEDSSIIDVIDAIVDTYNDIRFLLGKSNS
jgi:hypothetical protein